MTWWEWFLVGAGGYLAVFVPGAFVLGRLLGRSTPEGGKR